MNRIRYVCLRLPATRSAATLPRMLRKVPLIFVTASAWGLIGGCASHKPHRRTDDATLTQADLPVNVEKSFKRDHGFSTIKQIDKHIEDSVVQYRITYFDPDGTRHQASYDREGDTLDPVPRDDSNR